jgi:hypothetical protein
MPMVSSDLWQCLTIFKYDNDIIFCAVPHHAVGYEKIKKFVFTIIVLWFNSELNVIINFTLQNWLPQKIKKSSKKKQEGGNDRNSCCPRPRNMMRIWLDGANSEEAATSFQDGIGSIFS